MYFHTIAPVSLLYKITSQNLYFLHRGINLDRGKMSPKLQNADAS